MKCFEIDYAETKDDVDFKAGEMIFRSSYPHVEEDPMRPTLWRGGSIR